MKRMLGALALSALLVLLGGAELARGGGIVVVAPDPLGASACETGTPAQFIGHGTPLVVGCVRLGDRSIVQASYTDGTFTCLHLVAVGTTDPGICAVHAKSEVFGNPARLLGRPQIHVGPPLNGATLRWNSEAGQRRFVSGLASPDAEEIEVRYRLPGQDGTTAKPAAMLSLNEEQLAQLNAPAEAILYVAEIPPGRDTCAGAMVQARADGGAVDLRKVGGTDTPCEPRRDPAVPAGGLGLLDGVRAMFAELSLLLSRLI
jgi:hypothetical protein